MMPVKRGQEAWRKNLKGKQLGYSAPNASFGIVNVDTWALEEGPRGHGKCFTPFATEADALRFKDAQEARMIILGIPFRDDWAHAISWQEIRAIRASEPGFKVKPNIA